MIEEFLGVFNNLKNYIKKNKFVLSLILVFTSWLISTSV